MTKPDCCGRGCPDCFDGYSTTELLCVALEELQANLSFYKEDGGPADYMEEHVELLEEAIRYLGKQFEELNGK